jgi:hypothetical protein
VLDRLRRWANPIGNLVDPASTGTTTYGQAPDEREPDGRRAIDDELSTRGDPGSVQRPI